VVRKLVESASFRLRSFSGLASRFWQFLSTRKASPRLNLFAGNSKHASDSLLQNAALLSLSLHLAALLLLPTPGATGEVNPESRILIKSTRVEPEPILEPEPTPEPPAPLEPESNTVPDPEPAVDEPEPASDVREVLIEEPLQAVTEAPVEETPADNGEDSREQQQIDKLLEDTRRSTLHHQARNRWLMMEVREKVLNNLSRLHQGGASIHQGDGNASFLLGFRIDDEGWIYDISLRPAPGVQLDAFAVRDAVAILNPLAPPPRQGNFPVDVQLRVDFLDQR